MGVDLSLEDDFLLAMEVSRVLCHEVKPWSPLHLFLLPLDLSLPTHINRLKQLLLEEFLLHWLLLAINISSHSMGQFSQLVVQRGCLLIGVSFIWVVVVLLLACIVN
jgi:hypothetical protein